MSPRTDPRPSPAPPAPTRGDGGPTPRQLEDDEDGTYTPRFVSAKPSGRKPAVLTRSLNSPRINALNSPRAAPASRGAGSLGSPRASLPSGRREEPGEQVMSFSLARSLSSLSLSLLSGVVHLSICPPVDEWERTQKSAASWAAARAIQSLRESSPRSRGGASAGGGAVAGTGSAGGAGAGAGSERNRIEEITALLSRLAEEEVLLGQVGVGGGQQAGAGRGRRQFGGRPVEVAGDIDKAWRDEVIRQEGSVLSRRLWEQEDAGVLARRAHAGGVGKGGDRGGDESLASDRSHWHRDSSPLASHRSR